MFERAGLSRSIIESVTLFLHFAGNTSFLWLHYFPLYLRRWNLIGKPLQPGHAHEYEVHVLVTVRGVEQQRDHRVG